MADARDLLAIRAANERFPADTRHARAQRRAFVAGFLAQPATPVGALDVEQLARAIEKVLPYEEEGIAFPATYTAAEIAAEYARLAAASEPAGGGEG